MASDTAAPVIELADARFGYTRHAVVIDGVRASLRPGRVTALVGPNAAGKTTLLRLMLGLLRPWSGRVEVGGLAVHKLPPRTRARWLSYVPQQPGARFAFTARQIIAMGLHAGEGGHGPALDQAIERAGLGTIEHRVFTELSGGQQQGVLLARAELQAESAGRAMLLDEPGSHLDLRRRHETMRRLRELAAGGLAVLVVLHDLDLAARYADDAWLMHGGRIIADGPWQDVLTPERLSPVYGLPLRRIDGDGGDRPLLVVAGGLRDTMPS